MSSSNAASHGGSKDLVDRVLLLSWNDRPTCKYGRITVVDTCEFDGSDRAGRRLSVLILT
jgi:hypothetical protein